jgi:hypothetical protein
MRPEMGPARGFLTIPGLTDVRFAGRVRALVILVMLGLSSGCSGTTWNIDCAQMRSLRLGMSQAEVEKILGPPAFRWTEDNSGSSVHKEVDLVWNYSPERFMDEMRGLRFYVNFSKGKVVFVNSYRRKWFDESAGKTPTVFRLEQDGHLEGEEFTRWFCP